MTTSPKKVAGASKQRIAAGSVAQIPYPIDMQVTSSGLVHSAESDIERLQQILREGYASGFTIFKELLQNAEDAGAKRMIVAGYEGFPEASNPLLRTPGLIVANDGPVFERNMDGITRASGGSKADERSAVGRFGLGQKSVYHLCDAFVALGFVEDDGNRPRLLIMNPWEQVFDAKAARDEWRTLNDIEGRLLLDKISAMGLGKGMALFIPLRTATLRPGKDLCLSDQNWEPDGAITDIMHGTELAAALCCLRNLEIIEIKPINGEGRRLSLKKGARRLSGPGVDEGDAVIAGQVDGAGFDLSFTGCQQWAPDGDAAHLLQQDGWDKVFDIHRRLIPPKANPHGAVIVCRSSAGANNGVLRVRDTVYLPLGDPVLTEALDQVAINIDLLIHGYFFVSSNRKELRGDDHIESRWNVALRRETSLPLLLDALADAFASLPSDRERYSIIRALRGNSWWANFRGDACQGRALARCWPGAKSEVWRVHRGKLLRPVPRGEATSLSRLKMAFPEIEAWCDAQGIMLAFGTVLADEDPQWPDEGLADFIALAGQAAFTKGQVAQTLAALLDAATPGLQARAALAKSYREATAEIGQNFASADRLKALVRHLPRDRVLVLPASVDNRELIAVLAASGSTLPIKASWSIGDGAEIRRLDVAETVELLVAVEPFLSGRGEASVQASALVSHVLRHGPSLDELSRDERGRALQVIPARRMQNDADERLSFGRIAELKRQGLLFDAAPNSELLVLAAAIEEPAVYRLGLKDGGISDPASAKKADCLVAVLRQASSFGDPASCGELAELLHNHASTNDLRRLVARDPNLPVEVDLIELDDYDGVLDELIDTLRQGRNDRLVSSIVAAQLKRAVRQKVDLRRIDMTSVGDWLKAAHCSGDLPPIQDAAAMSLLKAPIESAILEILPLHKCVGEVGLHPATSVFFGRKAEIAPSLVSHARLVELWPDTQASQVQNRLIARWGPEAAIQTALSAPKPGQFTDEICAALAKLESLPGGLANQLASIAWITADGGEWRTDQVLDLPIEVESILAGMSPAQAGVILANRLPNCFREELVRERLQQVLPDRAASYELAFLLAAEAGTVGMCVDLAARLDDLQRLAQARADLGSDAWLLLAAALRDDLPDETITHLALSLSKPSLLAMIAQLNALAETTEASTGHVGEAARRLYHSGFALSCAALRSENGYLPANLLVPNELGNFLRADALALNAEGVALDALLARNCADGLGDEEPHSSQTAEPATGVPVNFLDGLTQAFGPLAKHDVGDGILLCLAMLGRDAAARELAGKWEGQRPFERICDDLDKLADEQREMRGAMAERFAELRFNVEFPDDGRARVRSAAGTDCIVPLSGRGEALLLDCASSGIERDEAGYRHVYNLVFGPISPETEDEAQALLGQCLRKIAPALMLGFDGHKQALSDLLASYFESDQRTLADTCAELKEVLHDRLRGIKPGPVMRRALREYDRNAFREHERENARDALWLAAQSEDGAAELLEATRSKIGEMGYEPHRTLFELYQNAVDAQAQWHGIGRFRVEAMRHNDGSIRLLRVIHWGRPINQPGGDQRRAEDEGHRRDLSNMLAINHSAKEGDEVTGRFGLGFKTVHMLADEIRLASAGIAIRILGGMIPAAWEDGGREITSLNDRGRKATLIEIPITDGLREDALEAWNAFHEAASLLAAIGQNGSIELADGEPELLFRNDEYELADGVSRLVLEDGKNVLCLDLSEGFRLLLPFGRNGPFEFVEAVPQFWHLVPLVGERRRGAWLMEGRFPVDPGRTQFSGSAEDKEILFSKLGFELGARLVAYYDFSLSHWSEFAQDTGLDPAGMQDFWRKLVRLFALDISGHGPERALHRSGRGLARLLTERPLVPLAFGGTVRSDEVVWRLDGAIADPSLWNFIESWPALEGFKSGLIDQDTASLLAGLFLQGGRKLNLPNLVENIIGEDGISPPLAESLATVLAEDFRNAMTGEEDREFRRILRDRCWLAEDGSWKPIRSLAFPQSGDNMERARSAFAPLSGRLSFAYEGAAFDLAKFADERSGGHLDVLQVWAATAEVSRDRQIAFIRYLADADHNAATSLIRAAAWLPEAERLAHWSLLDALSPEERGRLFANYGLYFESSTTPGGPSPEYRPDAEAALFAIAEWWRENREDLRPAYDRAVYPEDFSPASLSNADESAWFTMLALASFHTLGRTRPGQSREFVTRAMQEGWWEKLAQIEPSDRELLPFVERLRAWSEPDAEESYLMWRRCLTDLCMIARHLESYRKLFTKLPAIVAQEGDISLRNHLRPAFSQIAARMGIEAAPLARSLGIGANWMIRELSRHQIYSQQQSELIVPYGWSTAEKVRRLFYDLGLGKVEHGVDQGRLLHQRVQGLIRDESWFCGDGDLPLHIITLAKHRNELNSIFYSTDIEEWSDEGWDDLDDDDA